jgi:hypothetical protein
MLAVGTCVLDDLGSARAGGQGATGEARDSTINFSLPHQSSPDLLLAPEGDQEIPAQSDIASIRETGGKEAISVTRRIWRD